MPRKKIGRPFSVYNEERVQEIKQQFIKYIDETDIPIVCEFCHMYNVPSNRLYELEEIAETLKKCTDKKQAQLERKTYQGDIGKSAVAMAIFSLKQMGWKDRNETVIFDETKLSDSELDKYINEALNEYKTKGGGKIKKAAAGKGQTQKKGAGKK